MIRKQSSAADAACSPRLSLAARPLLSLADAARLTVVFEAMTNDTRVRILHHIVRSGEPTVTDIAKALGMKSQAVSNQLTRLSRTGIVRSRREGSYVCYSVQNVCVAPLLELALSLMEGEVESEPGNPRAV